MKLVKRPFLGTELPVIEIDGDWFCSTEQLQGVLGIDNKEFAEIVHKNPECSPKVFSPAELLEGQNSFCHVCKEIMTFFEGGRILLWSEGDVISASYLAKSEAAKRLRKEFIGHIKKHATRTYVE